MKLLSDRIRFLRKKYGLSQQQLAQAIGVSQSAIAHYESNTRLNPKKILEIAEVFNVNPHWLAQGKGAPGNVLYTNATSALQLQTHDSAIGCVTKDTYQNNSASWPFKRLSSDRYWKLSEEERLVIEETALSLTSSFEQRRS